MTPLKAGGFLEWVGKNGAVVRKLCGHGHNPQRWAPLINVFNQEHLTPYLHDHRPGFFLEIWTDPKGRARKSYRYEAMMTPPEKFKSLPQEKASLKPGVTFAMLDAIAQQFRDRHAADCLPKARQQLFTIILDRTENTGSLTHHRPSVQTHFRIGKY